MAEPDIDIAAAATAAAGDGATETGATETGATETGATETGATETGDARRYDLQELRLRIGLGCTAGEVADLGSRFGVAPAMGPGGRSLGVDEAARHMLRELDRRGQVAALVQALRDAKPLVEWPEPESPPPPAALEAPAPLPGTAPPAAPGGLADMPTPPAPGPIQWPADQGAPLASTADPEPSPARAPRPQPIVVDPLRTEGDSDAAIGASPWAATPRNIRLAIGAGAGLAIVLVAVSIGFAVGRTGSDAPAVTGPALAKQAADELASAVAQVARSCGVTATDGPTLDVLAQAFRRCDRSSLPRLPAQRPSLPEPPDPSPAAQPSPPAAGAPAGPPGRPANPGGGCMQRCQNEHKQCKTSGCGEEPTKGSEYDEYQRCLGRCLTRAAQCKMRCG